MGQPEGEPGQALRDGPRLLKAGELARHTGLTRQALHLYVQMGLIRPAEMTRGGQRLFEAGMVARIELIRKLCASGYTLQAVREIFIKER
jgi:DNA-binding transcriptional MerR regulator